MTSDARGRDAATQVARTAPAKPYIKTARFHAYFIYDVADTIDLARLQSIGGDDFQKAQLDLRTVSAPSYIQFSVPPLMVSSPHTVVDGHQAVVRLKFYDYGTVAIRLSFDYSGSWNEFADFTHKLRLSDNLTRSAETLLASTLKQANGALNKAHSPLLEDYFILEIESFEPAITSSELLNDHRNALASLMLSETRQLSALEQEEAFRFHFSYFETDLAVIQWDSAFVFDTREAAEAMENILEFANTQLVELRSYDARLDSELDEIYKWNLGRKQPHWLWGRRAVARRTDRLRGLLVDIQELTDRSSNAVKIIGDAFYARLYRGAAQRFCLSDWQNQIEGKLTSVGDVYRLATDEAQHVRSEFLELIIIALIVIEILLVIWGVGR